MTLSTSLERPLVPSTPLKSQVVFAPAGAGKTERLSRRYIELLRAGVPPERILTLTFTEKAAAEMKERIFLRLEQQDPDRHRFLRDNVLKVRISTIHSFCLSLVRRFAPFLGLDPGIDVLTSAEELWATAKYDTLERVATDLDSAARARLLDLVSREQVLGWTRLSGLFDALFARRTAVVRARLVPPDLERLETLARGLRADPVGRERFPEYARLFPSALDRAAARPPDPALLSGIARHLRENARVFLTGSGSPLKRGCDDAARAWNVRLHEFSRLIATLLWQDEFRRAFELFRDSFLAAYTRTKQELGRVDYDDMEFLALNLLQENPEWQNILLAFDEHTDHLLIDEFQDTSFIQWGIVDKLTEEWRSGEGAKAEQGIRPTVFIVGDDKQSIYLFRDAKVEVFSQAADRLEEWLGPDRFERVELEENYRSLSAVIDFNNALFSRLMAAGTDAEPWQTRYRQFRRARANPAPGAVEILLDEFDGRTAERRLRDAANVARRIQALTAPDSGFRVSERADGGEADRPCRFEDIAILLRQRTHLDKFESALRDSDIPFVVLAGTGFQAEPEVRYLKALLEFLVDPADAVALYVTLRGPLFRVPEPELLLAAAGDSPFLWDRLQAAAGPDTRLQAAAGRLRAWLGRVHLDPMSHIVEQALVETGAWRSFSEPQREANARRFLRLLEARELAGDHPLRILDAFSRPADEAKADVPTEGRDAVRIVTIHSAKGLEFPVVFVPGLDETIKAAGSSGPELVIEETGPRAVLVSYLPDSGARRDHPFHVRRINQELEEEKRVFYVACTRARDALFLSGIWSDKTLKRTRLEWLTEHLGLTKAADGFRLGSAPPGTRVVRTADIPAAPAPAPTARPGPPRLALRPPPAPPPPAFRSVTRYAAAELRRSPGAGQLAVGDTLHRVLEAVATGSLAPDPESLEREVRRLLRLEALAEDQEQAATGAILTQLAALKSSPAWDVIRPRPGALAELPVLLELDGTWYSGRIDRLIVTDHEVRIYDYKSFPVREADLPRLCREFHDCQLRYYAAAGRELFPGREVTTWLVFTAVPLVVRAG